MHIRKAVSADIKGIAKVHVDSWVANYGDIVSHDYLAGLSYEKHEIIWDSVFEVGFADACLFVMANEAGKIIGFAHAGKEKTGKYTYDGELYAIYILKEYIRGGIGELLLKHVAAEMIEKGYTSMLVWVLAENPSRHFYESFDSVEVDAEQIKMGTGIYEEIAYGWENISTLLDVNAGMNQH